MTHAQLSPVVTVTLTLPPETGAVKNVGSNAVQTIVEARQSGGRYKTLDDFCERVDLNAVNRRVIESLIKAGAMDALPGTRAQKMAIIDEAMETGQRARKDRESGQAGLFGELMGGDDSSAPPRSFPNVPEWDSRESLRGEKETIGYYVTGHPLTPLAPILDKYTLTNLAKLGELPNRSMTRIGGMIAAVTHGFSKKSGKPYSMVTLEDLEGSVQVLCLNENYEKFKDLLVPNKPLLVTGEVSTGEDRPKIFPQEIIPLEDAPRKYTKQVHLRLNAAHLKPEDMERIQKLVTAHPGKCPLFLCFMRPEGATVFVGAHERFAVMPSLELEQAANKLFGEKTYYARVDTSLPEPKRRYREKKTNGGGDE